MYLREIGKIPLLNSEEELALAHRVVAGEKKAKDKMAKFAPFILVANSFLKYAAVIEKTFGRCEVVAETSKFRVYKSQR